jgi:hypothetical protein
MAKRFRYLVFLIAFLFGGIAVEIYRSLGPPEVIYVDNLAIVVSPLEDPIVGVFEEVPLFEPEVEPHLSSLEETFSGWYTMEGKTGLRDALTIYLARDYSGSGDGPEVHGGVFTGFEDIGDSGFVQMRWIKLNENQVSFRTKTIKGFEFEFKGEFFKNQAMGEEGEELLRGTFIQFRQKKIVDKVSGDFSYYEPQCWH